MDKIVQEFGPRPIVPVRPSEVREWTARLREHYAQRTVSSFCRTLVQVFADAAHDGVIQRSPCSRRTSPPIARQQPVIASTEQVWALYEVMDERTRVAVSLGAFVGLRAAETCGPRVADIDFMRGVVTPAVQYPAQPLKTEMSRTAVPIPAELSLLLSEQVRQRPAATLLTDAHDQQLTLTARSVAFRAARAKVDGLPAGFRFRDLRHYFASLLIASGADVKVVQAGLCHASAVTTLDTYGHLWPDSDQSTRAAVAAVFTARADLARTGGGL
ncbi:MAG TPA: site-specific integrase [Sporichthyaceae bacterium]|nr:site-specific integrase [Sporichthyaceae bacterium]